MTRMYMNYPQPHSTIHTDHQCPEIRKNRKPSQRSLAIDQDSFSQTLRNLRSHEFQLGSTAQVNDAWFEIDFCDKEFEKAVGNFIHRFVGRRYKRIAKSSVQTHC